jgi:hypothetical protein
MSSTSPPPHVTATNSPIEGDVSWGVALILVGILFLAFAGTIKSSVHVGNGDPGPRAVPVAMSLVLIGGGVLDVLSRVLRRRRNQPQALRVTPVGLPLERRRVLYFVALTFAYVLLVPFAFFFSTLAFAFLTIWWFGARWWVAILAAASITAVVWGLFVKLFMVPLPTLLETLSRT